MASDQAQFDEVGRSQPGRGTSRGLQDADWMRPRLLLTVREVAVVLGIGRSKTYDLITAGDLEAVHIGRACRVPITAVEAYVERLRSE